MIRGITTEPIAQQSKLAEEIAEGACQYIEELLDAFGEESIPCQGFFRRLLYNRLQALYDCLASDPDPKSRGERVSDDSLEMVSRLCEQAESTEMSTRDLVVMQTRLFGLQFCVKPK